MSIRYLDLSGAVNFWTNIKNYILSKIPTKTSELTNDSGFLTSHQSLSNYVDLSSTQTITGKKLFTASSIQLDSVTSMYGSTMLIDTSASAPRGQFPAETHRVGRIYIGDGQSYNAAWFIVDPIINTNNACYRMVTTNPDNTDSTRFSIVWDSTKEGARRRRNVSTGDLICATNNTYQIGESGNAWKDAFINNIHGISDYTNLKTNSFNANTTLTHGGSGRRVILAMGAITLTVPAPEEGSWFLIKAVNGQVTLNLASNVTVTGITAGVFSGPIYLQPNESILLCYYSSTTYNATMSTIRRSGIVGRNGNVPAENPKHWFKVAENYVTANYRDPFICLRVFESTTGNTIGTLCAHCRINNTVGVVDTSNCYLQWQDAGSSNDLSKYALTTNETSGTGVTITLWCMLTGGWSSLKFEVVTEYGAVDQLGNPEWVLTRRRQADGDLAELLDTDFTKIVYSTLTTLKNDTTGKASNVTGTVAIANGGTGATTRLNAVKALTNEAVGTPTHFLTITTNWGKAGYTTVAQAKTVLGITGDIVSHSDSEYVHMSGNETIAGTKTFSSTITGSISGNAGTATQFSANKSVTLTGDVTGTASSKAGWSVATTLANSGVTAGTYGPSADVTGNNNATISVPEITVDAKGRVTSVTNRTLTCKNNTYNVYNKTLTIQKNGTNVATFTSNSNTDVTANITVPTKVSELTNDSGYLTSHQSLANYLTKTTNVSEMGRYIDLHYDNATSKYDYDVRLYADSQGTAAGGGSFKIAAASAYAPAPASNANDTRIATTAWVNSKGYLTSHPSITLSTNTTSTASPAHGGTFTCIDSVTQDTNGHITKVNTKTITLPADSNTDTKVTQTVTTANSGYPVLLCATANATTTETTTSRFSEGLTVNARYSAINMTNKYDTANTKGVRNTSNYSNGYIIFRCYDASEMGTIRCESSKNGYQQTYMQARSYIKNGAISPEGTSTTCYITVRVRDNGSKTIYTDGSWENSLTPYANNTHSLGTSSLQWKNAYAVNIYENGTALSSKYVLNENFGKGTTAYLYINATDFPTGSGSSIQHLDVVDGTKLYVWYSVCNSSSILDIQPTANRVTTVTGQVWRYLGRTVHATGLGHQGASPTGILGLFRRES